MTTFCPFWEMKGFGGCLVRKATCPSVPKVPETLPSVSGSNTGYVACIGGTSLIITRITQKWVWNNFSSWLIDVPWRMMICPLFIYNFFHSRLWGRVPKLATPLEFGREKTNTFYFTESFRCFRFNKSVLETTETKQADSQLCFAPKNIKNHLLVFENELIEGALLVHTFIHD